VYNAGSRHERSPFIQCINVSWTKIYAIECCFVKTTRHTLRTKDGQFQNTIIVEMSNWHKSMKMYGLQSEAHCAKGQKYKDNFKELRDLYSVSIVARPCVCEMSFPFHQSCQVHFSSTSLWPLVTIVPFPHH
jgi:hypothetical protein